MEYYGENAAANRYSSALYHHPNPSQEANNILTQKPVIDDPFEGYISENEVGESEEEDEDHDEEDEEEEEEEEEEREEEEQHNEEEEDDEKDEETEDGYGEEEEEEVNGHNVPFRALIRVPNDIYGSSSHPAGFLASKSSPNFPSVKAAEPEKHYSDWSDAATVALLRIWGAKYLQLGRKSLRLEDWFEVAAQIAHIIPKTDVQCRNRIDTLKKKYKREKQKQAALENSTSKWVYFKYMDELLNTVPRMAWLPWAVDAGQIIKTNPSIKKAENQEKHSDHGFTGTFKESCKVSGNVPNMSDEEIDAETNTISRKRKLRDAPFFSLAKAIKKFGKMYEKMETTKHQQILDLERTRLQLAREFEIQKLQLFLHTQMELAKLKQGNTDVDASVSNMSG